MVVVVSGWEISAKNSRKETVGKESTTCESYFDGEGWEEIKVGGG